MNGQLSSCSTEPESDSLLGIPMAPLPGTIHIIQATPAATRGR